MCVITTRSRSGSGGLAKTAGSSVTPASVPAGYGDDSGAMLLRTGTEGGGMEISDGDDDGSASGAAAAAAAPAPAPVRTGIDAASDGTCMGKWAGAGPVSSGDVG